MNKKEFIILFFITFLVIMAWIIFDILHSTTRVEINPKLEEARQPISPNFDTSIIKQINESRGVLPSPVSFTPPPIATTSASPNNP